MMKKTNEINDGLMKKVGMSIRDNPTFFFQYGGRVSLVNRIVNHKVSIWLLLRNSH